jgi:hypothetical protein
MPAGNARRAMDSYKHILANFVRAAAEPRGGNPTIAQLRQTMPAFFSAADTEVLVYEMSKTVRQVSFT